MIIHTILNRWETPGIEPVTYDLTSVYIKSAALPTELFHHIKVLKSIKIGHINLGRDWEWDCSILGIYYYLIKFIYI